jgi:GT2 family glycosyltransferase
MALQTPHFVTYKSAWNEHIPFAFWLVEHLRPTSIVELGVHTGLSYSAFCQAVKELQIECRCIGIDTFEGDPHAGVYGPEILQGLKDYHDPLYSDFSTLIQDTFDRVRMQVPDNSVDLLHIDGAHFYESAKHDFEMWLSKLSSRSVVLIHDTQETAHGFGVYRLWGELVKSYPTFEFHHGHGLGVVGVGDDLALSVRNLIGASDTDKSTLRQLFSHLGSRLTLEMHTGEIPLLNGTIASLTRTISKLENEASEASLALDNARAKQTELSRSLADSISRLEETEKAVHQLSIASQTGVHAVGIQNQRLASMSRLVRGAKMAAKQREEHLNDQEHYLALFRARYIANNFKSRFIALAPWAAGQNLRQQRKLVLQSKVFDSAYYLSQLPAAFAPADPIIHYLSVGWKCGLSPHRLFDTPWHQRIYRLELKGREPLTNFLKEGWKVMRCPNCLFDTSWYLKRYGEEMPEGENPLCDYLSHGTTKKRWPHPLFDGGWYVSKYRKRLSGQSPLEHFLADDNAWQHRPNALFDSTWYMREYLGKCGKGMAPLVHYCEIGAQLKFSPNPLFDVAWYLGRYPEVAKGPCSALEFYLHHKTSESSLPHPLFDAAWYLKQEGLDLEPGADAFSHYLDRGWRLGFSPHPFFDAKRYLERNPDVVALGMEPLRHYLGFGWKEGRAPNPWFDPRDYLERNPDVASAGLEPLTHYIEHGQFEDRYRERVASLTLQGVPDPLDRYECWLETNTFTPAAEADLRAALAGSTGFLPKLSVVMPVYNPPLWALKKAVQSVTRQIYENWQLCIADDCSPDPEIRQYLQHLPASDSRISVSFLVQNSGISGATNAASDLAEGEFLAFLDHDDELTIDALGEMALGLAAHPDWDMVYSDDDLIDQAGRRYRPQFKPDWSPTLLLSFMYMSHLLVVRRSVFKSLGGFRLGFEGSQDYDFALRASEVVNQVGHIPKILYHWRTMPGSTSTSGAAKPDSFERGRLAVQQAVERRKIPAKVCHPDWALQAGCGIFSLHFPDRGPKVEIVIMNKNGGDLVEKCLNSLRNTTYQDFVVTVADNASDDPHTLEVLQHSGSRIIPLPDEVPGKFSFSNLYNRALSQSEAEFVLLLNNDMEVKNPRWLSQMMGYALMEGVGAVGACLLFPDHTIQHAGMLLGCHEGKVGHAFKNTPAQEHGYMALRAVARESSGVTAACMLIRRDCYFSVGGQDEQRFAVGYNDADLCLKLGDKGLRSIYCGEAELFHHEGKSRGTGNDDPAEEAAIRAVVRHRPDRYYNPNLSLENERFEIGTRRALPHVIRATRTAFVTHNLNHEGAPRLLLELATGLKTRGDVEPVVVSPVDGPLRQEFEQAGIRVVCGAVPGGETSIEQLQDHLAHILLDCKAELVVANTLQTWWAVTLAHRAGIPSIWHVHESEPWNSYFDYLPLSMRSEAYRAFNLPYRIIFVARATLRGWEALNARNNFECIPGALDPSCLVSNAGTDPRDELRSLLGIEADEVVLILVGTVCDRKGQMDAVEAMALLEADVLSRTRLIIVGLRESIPYGQMLVRKIESLDSSLRGRIVIEKERADCIRFFKAGDISLCTSRVESYPRVILEAMACGLPIITTPVFGIVEQVRPGRNAIYYQPGRISDLARAVETLVRDGHKRRRFAASSPVVLSALPCYDEVIERHAALIQEGRLTRVRNLAAD